MRTRLIITVIHKTFVKAVVKSKPEKNSVLNEIRIRHVLCTYRCNALPTGLSSQLETGHVYYGDIQSTNCKRYDYDDVVNSVVIDP